VCLMQWGWIPLWILQTKNSLRGPSISLIDESSSRGP
jgi:hypothetical protein